MLELYFVVIDDVDTDVMSDDWNDVWDGICKREFFGLYVMTGDEFDLLNSVASKEDIEEFNWLVDDVENFILGGRLGTLLDYKEDDVIVYLDRFSSDSLYNKYVTIINMDHERVSIDDLVGALGKVFYEIEESDINRLDIVNEGKLTESEIAKYGELVYSDLLLGKMVVKALRTV